MLIVGNWKAYVENRESAIKLMATAKRAAGKTRVKIVVAPPAPYIGLLAGDMRSKVQVGAQDVSEALVGAATGEVTAPILRRAGASHVIVGHSERRARGETDAIVAAKVARVLANGLIPILCVGEQTRDASAAYLQELRRQIDAVYAGLPSKDRMNVIVAYEPVWAIGKAASDAINSVELAEMVLYIRKILSNYFSGKGAQKTKVLYGGSVDPTNIRELAGGSQVDGFLIGRASTDPTTLTALIKAVS